MERKFDPMTGEPIYTQQQPRQFDPMTGAPINNGAPIYNGGVRFDKMTGQPIYDDMGGGIPTPPKKKSSKKLIIAGAVAAAVVAVSGIAVWGFTSGAFLSAPNKVLVATANTLMDQSPFMQDMSKCKIDTTDEYTMNVNVAMEYIDLDAKISMGKDEKQVSVVMDAYGTEMDVIAAVDSEYLKVQVPFLSDDVLTYSYVDDKNGFIAENLSSEELEMIDSMIASVYEGTSEEYANDLMAAISAEYENLEFEKVDKEEFEVNGKDVNCKGYMTTITEDICIDFIDAIQGVYEEYNGDMDELMYEMTGSSTADMFEEMKWSIEGIPEMDVTFFVYKNKLACIRLEAPDYEEVIEVHFLGGDTRMQNMEITVDDEVVLEIEGEIDGDVQYAELSVDGYTIVSAEYDAENGDYYLEVPEGDMYLEGNMTVSKNEFILAVDTLYADGEPINDLELSMTEGVTLEEMDGELIDVGNASEEELTNLVLEYQALAETLFSY